MLKLPLLAAKRATDDWLSFASRSRLAHFVKLARTVRTSRCRDAETENSEATGPTKSPTGASNTFLVGRGFAPSATQAQAEEVLV